MNLLHIKYAVEVARIGSVKRTAEALLVTQPNLSRCIRELEESLGITIFDRTSRGMVLTTQGELFVQQAEKLLEQIEEIKQYYLEEPDKRQALSISVPRTSYLSDAFARFTRELGDTAHLPEVHYLETSSSATLHHVIDRSYRLGIIRYDVEHEKYFQKLLEQNGITHEPVTEFRYQLVMNRNSELARRKQIRLSDLKPLLEIVQEDSESSSDLTHLSPVKKEGMPESTLNRVHLFDRASQFDLLAENPAAFLWEAPLPARLLERYGLVQRECADNKRCFRDVLIHRKQMRLSGLEERFLSELFAGRAGAAGDGAVGI